MEQVEVKDYLKEEVHNSVEKVVDLAKRLKFTREQVLLMFQEVVN